MFFSIDLTVPHHVVAANTHYYKVPTEPLYIDRTLQYHDLIYMIDGEWMITEHETDYPLFKDNVLLLSAGYHHYTRLPCTPGTKTFCVHISSEITDKPETSGCLSLPTCMNVHGTLSVRHAFESIVNDYWSDRPHKEERLQAKVNMLFLQLGDLFEAQSSQQDDLGTAVIKLITDHPHERYKCTDVAQLYNVSTKTIESAMLKSTNMSFAKYQNYRKLEMVVSSMKVDPDIKLAEIATLFGFYDEFHLSRVFKQFYGMAPSRYRKMLNADE